MGFLDRVNRTTVTKSELLEVVTELADREPEDRCIEARVMLLSQLHPDNPDKTLSIEFRLTALSHLLGDFMPKGWTLPATPDGMVLTAEPVFAAASVQPVVEIEGRPGFDRDSFLEKVLELAAAEGNA